MNHRIPRLDFCCATSHQPTVIFNLTFNTYFVCFSYCFKEGSSSKSPSPTLHWLLYSGSIQQSRFFNVKAMLQVALVIFAKVSELTLLLRYDEPVWTPKFCFFSFLFFPSSGTRFRINFFQWEFPRSTPKWGLFSQLVFIFCLVYKDVWLKQSWFHFFLFLISFDPCSINLSMSFETIFLFNN